MEATQVPLDKRVNKKNGGSYICDGILLSHKKEQNPAICESLGKPR